MAYSIYEPAEIDHVVTEARKRIRLFDWLRNGVVLELARMVLQERANVRESDADCQRYRQTICDLSCKIAKLESDSKDGTYLAANLYLHNKTQIEALQKRLEDAWGALAEVTYGDLSSDRAKSILALVRLEAQLQALRFVEGCFHHYEQHEVYSEVSQYVKRLEASKKAFDQNR